MEKYLTVVWLVLYVLISFGLILPYLISAASSFLVWLGIAYLCSMPLVIYYIIFVK